MSHWNKYTSIDPRPELKSWCRTNKVLLSMLVAGMERYFPVVWKQAAGFVGRIPVKGCSMCGREFVMDGPGSKFCSDGCRAESHARGRTPKKPS